ncbi:hypothetical protein KAU40_00070 [Candidatus Parcubacteria bacterium]|nr:hypothetical protein [Candidatus Parcubacteria bacterium]
MLCKNCGKKSEGNEKFCTSCGASFSDIIINEEKSSNVGGIITILIILAVIGFGIYGSLDEESIETNNQGISSFDAGDSEQAIQQFQRASIEAVGDDTKMNTLINLGYVYSSELQYQQALQSFREALTYANKESFEYFLISGEIALLEWKPNAAKISYNKAYMLRPNDFQINNALNLFYLDDEVSPYYVDYSKALQYAQKAYDVSGADVKNIAKENLAIAHFFNENYDQSILLLSSFDVDTKPYIAYWLGWAYASKEDEVKAKFYFQKAVDAGVEVEQEVYDYLYLY